MEVIPGGPYMNLTGANEHVPEIERGIRVVKERIRALRHILPYNRIPFITLSRKIDFLGISHLPGRKIQNIFQAHNSLHRYYLQHGFRITTVHADGEFVPLKELIEGMPCGPSINLTGANEHVPEIEGGFGWSRKGAEPSGTAYPTTGSD